MKKTLIFAFTALLAVAVFTSCNRNRDLTIADLAGYTFVGYDLYGGTCYLTFYTDNTFYLSLESIDTSLEFDGTFAITGTNVNLVQYSGKVDVIGSENPKRLLYSAVVGDIKHPTTEVITLNRQKKK